MRSLFAILLLGCVEEQAGGECREGTYRQKDGHCALDDSEPSATDDTGDTDFASFARQIYMLFVRFSQRRCAV